MEMLIRRMDAFSLPDVDRCGDPFTVDSRLVLKAEDGNISYEIVPVPPHEKQYSLQPVDYAGYVDSSDRVVFLAYVEGELAGQVRIFKNWNDYAYIPDIAVGARFRRQGVGHALMQAAIEWAKEAGFPGLMLETQDINVAACLFYERCGFQLGGFDRLLYKAQNTDTEEVALFWYLLFPETPAQPVSS